MRKKQAPFIAQTAFLAQFQRMRGHLLTIGSGLALCIAIMSPDAASARETDSPDSPNCSDPRHRHVVVRPLTEPAPIRTKEKVRVRRILM
jgi:hypothetical protein